MILQFSFPLWTKAGSTITEKSHAWKTRICVCVLLLCVKWLWVQLGTTAFIRKSHLAGHACHFLSCRLFHVIRDIQLYCGAVVLHWHYARLYWSPVLSCTNCKPSNNDDPSLLLFFMGHKRRFIHSTQESTQLNHYIRDSWTGMRSGHYQTGNRSALILKETPHLYCLYPVQNEPKHRNLFLC